VAVATKVVVDKEDADKRVVEEATVKAAADMEVTDKRAAEEAAVKEMAVGVAEDSSAPGHSPSSVAGAKRAAAPTGSTPPAK
jgi:hypothetical protein